MILTRPVDDEYWKELGVSAHPVCPLPDEAWLRAHTSEELIQYLLDRDEVIKGYAEDPLNKGWEPGTWKILDALCGFPWMEDTKEKREWSLKVRRKLLHQDPAIRVLLLQGGNRGSKSEWASSRVMKLLLWAPGKRAWCLHQDMKMSRQYQQPLLYKYLPPELKTEKGIKKQRTYIAYKEQTGFSDEHFNLHNGSDCSFRFYEQKIESIQGGELDIVWADELMPATWVKEMKARVATRTGWLIISFTPVTGYTPTVKMFIDKAQTTIESTAFVIPTDGGEVRLDLALQGEDPLKWLEDQPAGAPIPEGREFAKVPRVMRCAADPKIGVFFFHSFDNPFGNPTNLYSLYASETAEGKKMRFYGVATKLAQNMFPKFNVLVHVVPRERIPKQGTRYQVVDPCSGRNWAMAWALVDEAVIGKRFFFYRNWPAQGQYVPGEGDMGAWAEPGDKHDGEMGPAQRTLGWGLERYQQEIYRVEGRSDWEQPAAPRARASRGRSDSGDPDLQPDPVRVRRHRARRPDEGEDVYERIMDSRFGAQPNQTREGTTTLLEECAEIGLDFVPASGGQTTDDDEKVQWTHLINNLLDYDATQPVSALNSPRLFVSEDCAEIIFALQNWTGIDGKKGACKDFIDLVKYLVLHDPDDWSSDNMKRGRERDREEAA